LGTVRWRIAQIYGKLQARNRIEALARAREQGWLTSYESERPLRHPAHLPVSNAGRCKGESRMLEPSQLR
jgi:hypothetical protein